MTRRRLSGNNAATALLAEVQPSDRRTPREEALLVLRFFGPINPALKTLPAPLLLRDEFGDSTQFGIVAGAKDQSTGGATMSRTRRRLHDKFGTVNYASDGQPISFVPVSPTGAPGVSFRIRGDETIVRLEDQQQISPEDAARCRAWFIADRPAPGGER